MCLWLSLRFFNINILAFETDGDRGNIPSQERVFRCFDRSLDDEIALICDCVLRFRGEALQLTWWIADPLHVLKCQRCSLRRSLSLSALGPVINAALLNKHSNLRHSLTDLLGANKMNDTFAVQVLSLDIC
jgi:hypothetical protein